MSDMAKPKQITAEEANNIIDTREPRGLFWLQVDNVYVGIDNSSGDAWTEELKSKASCLKWLKGERVKDAHGNWLNA